MSGLILVYLVVLLFLYMVGKHLWKPFFILFSLFFQGSLGVLGIYLFNLIATMFTLQLPLNPYNSLVVGFLGIPGLLMLLAARYLLKF